MMQLEYYQKSYCKSDMCPLSLTTVNTQQPVVRVLRVHHFSIRGSSYTSNGFLVSKEEQSTFLSLLKIWAGSHTDIFLGTLRSRVWDLRAVCSLRRNHAVEWFESRSRHGNFWSVSEPISALLTSLGPSPPPPLFLLYMPRCWKRPAPRQVPSNNFQHYLVLGLTAAVCLQCRVRPSSCCQREPEDGRNADVRFSRPSECHVDWSSGGGGGQGAGCRDKWANKL